MGLEYWTEQGAVVVATTLASLVFPLVVLLTCGPPLTVSRAWTAGVLRRRSGMREYVGFFAGGCHHRYCPSTPTVSSCWPLSPRPWFIASTVCSAFFTPRSPLLSFLESGRAWSGSETVLMVHDQLTNKVTHFPYLLLTCDVMTTIPPTASVDSFCSPSTLLYARHSSSMCGTT